MNQPRKLQTRTSSAPVSEALQQLRSGAITLDDYLSAQLEAAIGPFRKVLHQRDLELVRWALEYKLENDPITAVLIERVAGRARSSSRRDGGSE